jgi:succinate dehydrogenase / fumarate reductase membrane anchor subunit
MREPNSQRTDFARIRYLGSARSGTAHMWHTRVTAVALLPLAMLFVLIVLSLLGSDFATVRARLSHPLLAIPLLLFIMTGIYHMQLGMRTIIEDYVHGETAKTAALMANLFFSAVVGLACVFAVLKLSLLPGP